MESFEDQMELEELMEDQIGQAGEIDWEEELSEIVEYLKTVVGLKSKNPHIFRKIMQNSDKSRNHKKSRTSPKNVMRDLDKSDAQLSEVQQGTKQVENWQIGNEMVNKKIE